MVEPKLSALKENIYIRLNQWFADAASEYDRLKIPNFNAGVLSSCFEDEITSRVVLFNLLGDDFIFFTNLNSPKIRDITKNTNVAGVFFWPTMGRQLRIQGKAEILKNPKISDEYFANRSYMSKIGAWASSQSSPIENNYDFVKQLNHYMLSFSGNVDRPPYWGAVGLYPSYFEFWEERPFRLHNRICYTWCSKVEQWCKKVLYP